MSLIVDTGPTMGRLRAAVAGMLGVPLEQVEVLTTGTVRDGVPGLDVEVRVRGAAAPDEVQRFVDELFATARKLARREATEDETRAEAMRIARGTR